MMPRVPDHRWLLPVLLLAFSLPATGAGLAERLAELDDRRNFRDQGGRSPDVVADPGSSPALPVLKRWRR
ncbi:MAG: hypothetical protein U5L11_10525 [Arhodomonas sp.]|nr:hypothetical protein [Arhodomonas sp.]